MPDQIVTPFRSESHNHKRCVTDAMALAEERCARRGARLTRIRRRVLELIWSRHEPVKAYDLLDQLREEHRGAAPPTIYRALDFLLSEGLIHRIESLNAYIGCGDPSHPHLGQFLICERCNAVAEMDDDDIRDLLARKAALQGFHVNWQTIEINGVCPSCRATRNGTVSGDETDAPADRCR